MYCDVMSETVSLRLDGKLVEKLQEIRDLRSIQTHLSLCRKDIYEMNNQKIR